jgi:hypothetical protein
MRTTIALACAAAAVSAGAALGAPPVEPVQVLRIDETETIPAGALCAFPVQIRTVGHVRIKVEQNRFFSNPNLRDTLTGPGGTLTSKDVGLDRSTLLPDGTVQVLSRGIHFQARTPDGVKVLQGIGARKTTVSPSGDVDIDFKNPNDSSGEAACAFL